MNAPAELTKRVLAEIPGYPVRRFPPMQPKPLGKCWTPTMTPEEKAAHDKYVADNNLPF